MSLDTYSNLKTSIASWMNRDDLTSQIDDFIDLAEARMNLQFIKFDPPLRALEQTATGTISAATLAIPSGYQGIKSFVVTASSGEDIILTYKTPSEIARYVTTDKPRHYTTNGDNFEFGPVPDGSYSYTLVYYKKLTALSDANTTNWALTNAPQLYLFGPLFQAEPFLKNDTRITVWGSLYDDIINKLDAANQRDRISGGVLVARSDTAPRVG